ncbi:MAG: hypothetical protein ACXW03_02610 [Methylobacter sp.]
MSLTRRLAKLEAAKQPGSTKRIVLIPVYSGETKEQAVEQWKLNNPHVPPPDQIIFLIPFGYEESHENQDTPQ